MLQCKDLAPILSLLPGHPISQIIFVHCQCHVGAVLPQQGYLWWLTSMCTESLLWSCCFARTSCCHKSSWKSSSDLNLMDEVSRKKWSRISGAGICVAAGKQSYNQSTHSMNFTKMTHLEFFNATLWWKEKATSSGFPSFLLKNNDTVSVVADKNEGSVREVSWSEQS